MVNTTRLFYLRQPCFRLANAFLLRVYWRIACARAVSSLSRSAGAYAGGRSGRPCAVTSANATRGYAWRRGRFCTLPTFSRALCYPAQRLSKRPAGSARFWSCRALFLSAKNSGRTCCLPRVVARGKTHADSGHFTPWIVGKKGGGYDMILLFFNLL